LNLNWGEVLEVDLKEFAISGLDRYRGKVDLVAGGVPCPPFSKAGLQLGKDDERDLFPTALKIVQEVKPSAVMLENVAGLLEKKFSSYRTSITRKLAKLGYRCDWQLIQASDYGVSQLRPRAVLVAFVGDTIDHFEWPEKSSSKPPTVGELLSDLMGSNNWEAVEEWKKFANKIAPTIVGGSKKHGGPDLGPTRAKEQWKLLHVNAHRIANDNEIPAEGFEGVITNKMGVRVGYEKMPLLNNRMAARLQGFPDEWLFSGAKTHAYRQIGNAFPPPVAEALGRSIMTAIQKAKKSETKVA
jgi:DNA (cytosine-5)-methyltransferase 1